MKGISEVVAVILLLLITISVIGFAFAFFQRIQTTAQQSGQQQLQQQTSAIGTSFNIESVDKNQVVIRNTGTQPLANLNFYVNNQLVNYSGTTVQPGSTGVYYINDAQLPSSPVDVKVTSLGVSKDVVADPYARYTVGYWKFDESSGTTVSDSSRNGNDGSYSGWFNDGTITGATQSAGKYGSSLSFNGAAGNRITVNNNQLLNVTPNMTVEAWIYVTSAAGAQRILGKYYWYSATDQRGSWIMYMGNSMDLLCSFNVSGSFRSANAPANSIALNTWQHVACVFNGTHVLNYVDGNVKSTTAITGSVVPSEYNICVGCSTDNTLFQNHFYGNIDEVRIYDRALTGSEINASMNSAYPLAKPLTSFSFEDISGGKAKDTKQIVQGYSGLARSFNGINDTIAVQHSSSLNLSGEVTLDAWVYDIGDPNATHGYGIISKAARDSSGNLINNGQYELMASGSNGRLAFRGTAGPQFSASCNYIINATSVKNTWQHLIVTFNGSVVKCYVNGILDATAAVTGITLPLNSSTDVLAIGARGISAINGCSSNSCFNGMIDEVRILNVARTMAAG